MTSEKLLAMLCQACDRPLTEETELLQSGYLDSLALVLSEEELEAAGEVVSVARIPREAVIYCAKRLPSSQPTKGISA